MLRRFSTKIGLSKEKAEQTNGRTNGTSIGTSNGTSNGVSKSHDTTTNGATNMNVNGASDAKPVIEKRPTIFSQKSKKETANHNGSRGDVEASFTQFAQLVHAARRPLPTQTGDGAYLEHAEPSGLLADIKVRYTIKPSDVSLLQMGELPVLLKSLACRLPELHIWTLTSLIGSLH